MARGGLIKRQHQRRVADLAQVQALAARLGCQVCRLGAAGDMQRVKRAGVRGCVAQAAQTLGNDGGVGRHAARNAHQALGPVVDRKHAGHHSGEYLRGADVGGGFLAPYVLLAGLQGQPVRRLPLRIHAHAHQSARHGAFVGVAAGKKRRVWATTAHGHAKALRAAHHDVCVPLARWCEQGQRQQVAGHAQRGLFGV